MGEGSGIQVICAGLPRTGTKSLSQALELLLGGHALHGSDLPSFNKEQIEFWTKALQKNPTSEEWQRYFKTETSCLDYPCVLFYQDIMTAYPKAKVILTTRNPDTWYQSWTTSIKLTLIAIETQPVKWVVNCLEKPGVKQIHENARAVCPRGCSMNLNEAFSSPEKAKTFYEEWMNEAYRVIPKDRLLVYNIKDGWDPLCTFLNVAKPDIDFPRVNETDEIKRSIVRMKLISWALTLSIPALSITVGFWLWKKLR